MRGHRLLLGICCVGLLGTSATREMGTQGMVAVDHELASQAGAWVLAEGGNAVDAAVAAALAAGVVQPASSGLGGGGFAVIWDGEGSDVLDFREVAPATAHRDLFLGPDGEVVEGASTRGGLAVAVPGEARGLATLHRERGRLPLQTVAAPAIRLAEEGFACGEHLADRVLEHPDVDWLLEGEATPGALVRRPRLAAAIRAWASTGGEALNTGPLARDLQRAVQEAGGVLTVADLDDYRPVHREALVGTYRGYTIVTMPPPSSGGVVLLQVLSVLEAHDLTALGHNSSAHLHLLAESMKHAYADRAAYMGDPAFVEVPLEALLSEERVLEIRGAFDPDATHERSFYGASLNPGRDGGTQHIAVLDGDGMAVALTTTINTSFGSEVVAPITGIILNNEMDDFSAAPGVPNAYGLVGREANAVEAGKKPLSSMTPTIVLNEEGQVVMVVGASGGPFIISSTLQVISNVLDFGLDVGEAVTVPRMHHQWVPDKLFVDLDMSGDVTAALGQRGHLVEGFPFFSSVQVIVATPEGQEGASDPRKGGRAAGVP